jgi:hypothetical protein
MRLGGAAFLIVYGALRFRAALRGGEAPKLLLDRGLPAEPDAAAADRSRQGGGAARRERD